MSTKLNEAKSPAADTESSTASLEQNVRNFLIRENSGPHYLRATIERIRSNRNAGLAMVAGLLVVVAVGGYLMGKANAEPAEVDPSAGYFITGGQAQELRQQAAELSEAKSQLVIAEGELAFLRDQVGDLTADAQTQRTAADRRQVELGIMIGVYEECLRQAYPAECVEDARPDAERFIAELYPSGG